MKNISFLLALIFIFSCSQDFSMPSTMKNEEVLVSDVKMETTHPAKKNSKTWKRSNINTNSPIIFIGDNEKLPLKGAQVSVKIDGFRARVLIDAFFYSDKNRQLEGTFKMRLPQGASPYYFAFGQSVLVNKNNKIDSILFLNKNEISFTAKKIEEMRSKTWTAPKIARVVPKDKAALAYGQTVQRKIDPALAEWAGSDVYNCRVFPLAPKTMHRIVIGYDVNLTAIDNDWVYNFQVPSLEGPFVLDFDIADINDVQISSGIQINHSAGRKSFRLTNPSEQQLSIRYSGLENFSLNSISKEEPYFSAIINPNIPPSSNIQVADNAILALDISLSSNPDKFNIWLQLAEAILKNNSRTIKKFKILLFNIESYWWKEGWVENTPENIRLFLAFANNLSLEGASDINQAFSTITLNSWTKNSRNNIFLLSDGADTWGEEDPYEVVKNIKQGDRLFAYNTGLSGTNIQKLNHYTRVSGGALFSITGEDEIQKISRAFLYTPWRIEAIKIKNTDDILIAGRPKFLYTGQKLLISGRGNLSKFSTIELKISQNGIQKSISIPINRIISSELTDRIYGQLATGILEAFGYTTEKKSVSYAKHFAVPGNTCSLLMLESESDYQAYNIKATEDAFVVKSTQVNNIIKEVLQNINELMGNAKNKFKHWVTRLTHTAGMDFEISTALEVIIDQTSASKFIVRPKNIITKSRKKTDYSSIYHKILSSPELDYDKVVKESQRRSKKHSAADGLKVLSSLIEKNPGNTTITRDVAYSALAMEQNEQAYFLFRRVLNSRPYEPQTYLAIAKALSNIGKHELSIFYYEIAVTTIWDPRFGAFRRIAALDYLHTLQKLKKKPSFTFQNYAQSRYQTLRQEFKEKSADLMMVITWNTDNTDIDLHVIEPNGEECYYKNRNTAIGGHLTKDVTQGYGPEMYLLQKGKKGAYQVSVKYFSTNRNRMSTRTKVYATIYKNWGTSNESVITKVIPLMDNKEMHKIVRINL